MDRPWIARGPGRQHTCRRSGRGLKGGSRRRPAEFEPPSSAVHAVATPNGHAPHGWSGSPPRRRARNLERVADLATNIADEVVFIAEARIIKHHVEEAPTGGRPIPG
jgi:hypothetical protein